MQTSSTQTVHHRCHILSLMLFLYCRGDFEIFLLWSLWGAFQSYSHSWIFHLLLVFQRQHSNLLPARMQLRTNRSYDLYALQLTTQVPDISVAMTTSCLLDRCCKISPPCRSPFPLLCLDGTDAAQSHHNELQSTKVLPDNTRWQLASKPTYIFIHLYTP